MEKPAIRDDQGPADDREDGDRALVGIEVPGEQLEPVRVPPRPACEAQEFGSIECVREPHGASQTRGDLKACRISESAPPLSARGAIVRRRKSMPDRFHPLDARLDRDLGELHDCLWVPGWAGDRDALRADILRDARSLDRFLEVGGSLHRNVVTLSRRIERAREGTLLFEFLSTLHRLTAATERLRKGDIDGASASAARTAEGLSIGACSLIGRFDLVEAWEAGKTDFEGYTRSVADALEAQGYGGAGEFKRMLNVAHSLARSKAGSREERAIAARAAVASALWCGMALGRLRRAVGTLPAVPFRDYPKIVARIAARSWAGAHA